MYRLKVYVHEDVIALIAMDDYAIPEKPKEQEVQEVQPAEPATEDEPKEGTAGMHSACPPPPPM
jgi:hypothetical protein